MEDTNQFMIQFRNDEVILDLVEQTLEKSVYKVTRYNYDINAGDKSKLTITVETSPITDKEKRSVLFFNLFTGKGNDTTK